MKMSDSEMMFSCRMCLRSLSSRYVRFARTGVEKGFIIFLMATLVLVSWSFAEHTSPNAPIPTGCRSTYRVVTSKHVPNMDSFTKSAMVNGLGLRDLPGVDETGP